MNLNKKILLSLCMLFAAATTVPGQNCKARVSINTDIDNSQIFINNKPEGQGSVVLDLEKGNYLLLITGPVKEWGTKTFNDTIKVNSCEKISLSYSFNNRRFLDSEPQDAEVIVNDSSLGYTPLFVPVEVTKFMLKKPSYEPREIEIKKDKTSQTFKLNFIGKEEDDSFYKRPVFKYLLGGIVVLGVATAYFKIKADNFFSNYQKTSDNTYLDQTHKYDLLSGISFGALQVNLGVLIYYFLSD